jgi:hypothetical protein
MKVMSLSEKKRSTNPVVVALDVLSTLSSIPTIAELMQAQSTSVSFLSAAHKCLG